MTMIDSKISGRVHRWRARHVTLLLATVVLASCNLDLRNPNSPTEEQALSSNDGVISVAVGVQGTYARSIEDYVLTGALLSDEWGTSTTALPSYRSLFTGETFDPGYDVVLAPWSNSYQVIRAANTLLDGGIEGTTLSSGFKAGLTSVTKLFKAMAYGQLALHYEEAPIDVSAAGPEFRPRAELLDTVLVLLDEADAALAAVPAADLTGFNTRALAPGLDLPNTIAAMKARYALIAGRYQDAIDAADEVDEAVVSEFRYPTPLRNPIQDLAINTPYVAGLVSWAEDAEAADDRPAYWLDTSAPQTEPAPNPPDSLLYTLLKYSLPSDPFPLYIVDEMKLIQAEALTRLGGAANFAAAENLINAVRTDATATSNDPAAGLGALTGLDTEAELLAQIAYERKYELYMQGLRWEDTRRLDDAITEEPVFEFLPTPQRECLTNPSDPCGT